MKKHTLEPRLYFLNVVSLLQCFFPKAVTRQKAEFEAMPSLVFLAHWVSMKKLGR